MPLLSCRTCGAHGWDYQIPPCFNRRCTLSIVAIEEPHAPNPIHQPGEHPLKFPRPGVVYVPPHFCTYGKEGG